MTAELGLSDAPVLSLANNGIAFAPAVTPDTYQDATLSSPPLLCPLSEPDMFSMDFEDLEPRRSGTSRRKTSNHIPRPPNAFILFRSAFIRSQRVTSGVESSHSTLSKIIGLTWQQLSNEERQKWHAKARLAQEEHKRRYPQYSFKPIHHRTKGAKVGRRKLREVGPKDQKRCEKIAELLASGKKGQDLEEAIKEFDKYHVPQILTRFEEPITASSFSNSSRGSSPFSTYSRRSTTPSSQGHPTTPRSSIPTPPPVRQHDNNAVAPIAPILSFNSNALFPSTTHSFEIDNFTYPGQSPSPVAMHGNGFVPVIGSDSVEGYGDVNPIEPVPSLFRFAHIDEWAPRSPLSQNSAGSLPTTPASHPTSVSFPEQNGALYDRHAYPPFTSERYHNASDTDCPRHFPSYVTPDYGANYSQHHAYSSQLSVPEICYGEKRTGGVASSFLVGNPAAYPVPKCNTMARDELDLSILMASFDPPIRFEADIPTLHSLRS